MKKIVVLLGLITFINAQATKSDSIPKLFQKGSKSVQYGIDRLLIPTSFGGMSFTKKEFVGPLKAKRKGLYLNLKYNGLQGSYSVSGNDATGDPGIQQDYNTSNYIRYSEKLLNYFPINKSMYLYKGGGYTFQFSGYSRLNKTDVNDLNREDWDHNYSILAGYGWAFGFEYLYRKNISIHIENNFGILGGATYIKQHRQYRENISKSERIGPTIRTFNTLLFGFSIYY